MTRSDRLLSGTLVAATFLAMWGTHEPIGHVRDEGYYFKAATDYEGWFLELGNDFRQGRFAHPFEDATIMKHWEYNREHPPLAKLAFTFSHLVLFRWLGVLDETTALRFPGFRLRRAPDLALWDIARRHSRTAGVVAPLLFWTIPRHFFHAHISCFDIPVAALWCLFIAAYLRWIDTGRGAIRIGVLFGLALATKHNAFFLPFVAGLHWLITDWRDLKAAGIKRILHRVPAPLWAMAVLGPIILYASWPVLWHAPVERLRWWLAFHSNHKHYPWQYFGTLLREPPFPVLYPITLEFLTVPATTLLAILLGYPALRTRLGDPKWARGEWAVVLGAFVAIAPFLTTRVPIFGGIKHWMAAVALACVVGAYCVAEVGKTPVFSAILTLLVLAPATWATAHFHPFGTSAYTELAGGATGAAALGMQRQYWSNNVTAVLPWINEHAPKNASVYFHEVNWDSFQAYRRENLIRADLRYASEIRDSTIAAYQYHQEFRGDEFEIWTEYGKRTPEHTFTIDDAPQVVVYAR